MIIDNPIEEEKKPLLRWWHVVLVFALGHIFILFGVLILFMLENTVYLLTEFTNLCVENTPYS